MDTLECIKTRRSIRKFRPSPVEWDKVGSILDAGRYAPNAGNLQNWQFMVFLDEKKRKAIAEASAEQHWMAEAPVHIIICEKPEIQKQYYGIRGERLYSVQGMAAAAENMLLAAHALGLGTCWIGAFDEHAIKRIGNIPDRARPQAIIVVGYADEVVPTPGKLTLENVTYLETYGENIGRIKDIDAVLGFRSQAVMDTIEKGKEVINKASEHVEKESISFIDKIKEKLRGKKEE